MGSKYTKAQKEATKKHMKNAYFRPTVLLPEKRKDEIKDHAAMFDGNVNKFINRAIAETMERDNERTGKQ